MHEMMRTRFRLVFFVAFAFACRRMHQVHALIRHGARGPYTEPRCWEGYDIRWDCTVTEVMIHTTTKQDTLDALKHSRRDIQRLYLLILQSPTMPSTRAENLQPDGSKNRVHEEYGC